MTQLAQCLGFDLADSLTGHIEDLANFLEGLHTSVIQAVAKPEHVALSGAKGRQHAFEILTQKIFGHVLLGILDIGFDEVAEAGILFFADRGLKGDRQLGALGDEAQLFNGHFH